MDTPGAWEDYRVLKREYKSLIRRAKRSSWQKFCSSFAKINDSHRIGKLLKGVRKVQLDVLQKTDGTYTSDPSETLELMMSVHYPGSEQIEGASTYNAPRLNWDEGLSLRFLTAERIAKSISSFDAY